IKIRLLLEIHEQYSTVDSGIDVTGLDATWTHKIAIKEKSKGNRNGTVSSPKNAGTVLMNKANFHVLECEVPAGAHFHVGIPINSVKEVNNRK
nr:hypothetical protein [Tanacetum cinerariifolium]